MTKKVRFLCILLFLLAFGLTVGAQSLQQSQNGSITVRVLCNCQLITEKSNQPLHFMANGKNQRDTKHVKIASNCNWNLRVVTNRTNSDCDSNNGRDDDKDKGNKNDKDKNCKNDKDDKNNKGNKDNSMITYTFKNFKGKGKLLNPNEKYVLGSAPQNLAAGIGELEFDVVFELEGKDQKKSGWGKENTWVSFYVLPKE